MDTTAPTGKFHEIRRIVATLPGPDRRAGRAAKERSDARRGDPDLVAWMAAWQRRVPPTIERPRIAVFAGLHGVALAETETARDVATDRVRNILDGQAEVHALCGALNADLRLYEMALDRPTRDFTRAAAMEEDDCARALSYGMMAVEDGIDVLGLGAVSPGAEIAAAAIGLALCGGDARNWAPGRRAVIADRLQTALALHAQATADAFEVLRRLGGPEMAALLGAMIAARIAGIPVIVDGVSAIAGAIVLDHLKEGAASHCRIAQSLQTTIFKQIAGALETYPLIGGGNSCGDGEGAARALVLLRGILGGHDGPIGGS